MPGFAPPGSVPNTGYYAETSTFGPYYEPSRQPFAPPSTQKLSAKTLYGSVPFEEEYGAGAPMKDGLVHLSLHPDGGRRARIDVSQVLITMVLPVLTFVGVAAVLSFKIHYNLWLLAWIIAWGCALPGLYVGWLSMKAFQENEGTQGRWMRLLCVLCFLAWLLAMVLGQMNYSTNMLPFYEMSGLNYYPSVDPSTSAQSHMDAGRMLFQRGSHLDFNRAMGVRISKTYCVAPVVSPKVGNATGAVEIDYWAVGMDCCSSVQPQTHWRCGEIDNPFANAGMRLMSDAERPFYRMAVQEAEATYKVRANHPIFIHWMQDPAAKMQSWHEAGTRMYIEGVFSVVVLMFFFSCSAGLYFSRASMESHPCKGTGFRKYVAANPQHDFLAEEGWEEASSTKSIIL